MLSWILTTHAPQLAHVSSCCLIYRVQDYFTLAHDTLRVRCIKEVNFVFRGKCGNGSNSVPAEWYIRRCLNHALSSQNRAGDICKVINTTVADTTRMCSELLHIVSHFWQYITIMYSFDIVKINLMPDGNPCLQYIPRNMHTVFALLCFVVVIHWLIFPYPSGLLHWHCGNLTIAPVPAKQPWWIWINISCGFIMNDCITTTKQSTTNPCAYFLGYTVTRCGLLCMPCRCQSPLRNWLQQWCCARGIFPDLPSVVTMNTPGFYTAFQPPPPPPPTSQHVTHDDVMPWKRSPHYWPFVRRI